MTLTREKLGLLANLAAYSGVNKEYMVTAGRTAVGDGGGGEWVFDASDLSTEVAADTLQGIYVAAASDATGASGAWVRQHKDVISVNWFGAVGDDTADNLAAFDAATAFLNPWDTLYIPQGEYRLSATWNFQVYRGKLKCDGILKPHGVFDDYLMEVNNTLGGDPIMPSMGLQLRIEGLRLDCEWQSRGVKFRSLYDATVDVEVWKPYGEGIRCAFVQEATFIKPAIFAGKPRVDATIAAAADWLVGTAYTAGDLVKRVYPAYNAGTTYAFNDMVDSGGNSFRSIASNNTGNNPLGTPSLWELVPYEYFENVLANTGSDPADVATDYTTRSGVTLDKIWKPVYPDEAAFAIIGDGSSTTVDNIKMFNPISRSNAQLTFMRIDNPEFSTPIAKVELYAPQFHSVSAQYQTAFNSGGYGWTLDLPEKGHLIHAPDSTGLKIFGGQTRTASVNRMTCLRVGTQGSSGNAASTVIVGHQFNGDGTNEVGISAMPSLETFDNWKESANLFSFTDTGIHDRIDPDDQTTTGSPIIPWASIRFLGSAAVVGTAIGVSVSSAATGVYDLVLDHAVSNLNNVICTPIAITNTGANNATYQVNSTTSITVRTANSAGTLVDSACSVIVYNPAPA